MTILYFAVMSAIGLSAIEGVHRLRRLARQKLQAYRLRCRINAFRGRHIA